MDASEALLRGIALRLALLLLAVFVARTVTDNRPIDQRQPVASTERPSSMGYVSPAAKLANAWDTKLGGALADAISCNSVVKAFGAEDREEVRLGHVLAKWDSRTRRTWRRGTVNGTIQGVMMVSMQAGILGTGLVMWQKGLATAGDITFVLAMFFVLQGYLRSVG